MRPAKYVKIITSQLEQFEDMKTQLESLLEDIKHIINQGQSWVDETGNTLSFTQMNQLLAGETSNCIQKCLNITLEEENMNYTTKVNIPCSSSKISSPNSGGNIRGDRDLNEIQMKLNEFEKRISTQSTKLKSIKQKVKRQEKQNEIISIQLTEKDKNNEVKFKDIMIELHAASDFMSNLQIQTEMLANEHEKKLNGVIEKLTDQEEKIKVLTTNQKSDAKKLQDGVEEILPDKVVNLKGDIETVKSDLDKNNEKFTKMSSEFDELSESLNEMSHLNNKKTSLSFSVGLIATTTVLKGCVVKYDTIFTNMDNCYNMSTGIFTCPTDGHYVFRVNLLTFCDKLGCLFLFQNNESKKSVRANIPDCGSTHGNSVILHLKLNDQVFLKSQNVSVLHGNSTGICNTFSGFLLAAD
ncbi:hypothetical protein Btru_033861 [Bulinus truncatus]|nr:hypothetical protein Btru_033861 [Bulinus truncatus]